MQPDTVLISNALRAAEAASFNFKLVLQMLIEVGQHNFTVANREERPEFKYRNFGGSLCLTIHQRVEY